MNNNYTVEIRICRGIETTAFQAMSLDMIQNKCFKGMELDPQFPYDITRDLVEEAKFPFERKELAEYLSEHLTKAIIIELGLNDTTRGYTKRQRIYGKE